MDPAPHMLEASEVRTLSPSEEGKVVFSSPSVVRASPVFEHVVATGTQPTSAMAPDKQPKQLSVASQPLRSRFQGFASKALREAKRTHRDDVPNPVPDPARDPVRDPVPEEPVPAKPKSPFCFHATSVTFHQVRQAGNVRGRFVDDRELDQRGAKALGTDSGPVQEPYDVEMGEEEKGKKGSLLRTNSYEQEARRKLRELKKEIAVTEAAAWEGRQRMVLQERKQQEEYQGVVSRMIKEAVVAEVSWSVRSKAHSSVSFVAPAAFGAFPHTSAPPMRPHAPPHSVLKPSLPPAAAAGRRVIGADDSAPPPHMSESGQWPPRLSRVHSITPAAPAPAPAPAPVSAAGVHTSSQAHTLPPHHSPPLSFPSSPSSPSSPATPLQAKVSPSRAQTVPVQCSDALSELLGEGLQNEGGMWGADAGGARGAGDADAWDAHFDDDMSDMRSVGDNSVGSRRRPQLIVVRSRHMCGYTDSRIARGQAAPPTGDIFPRDSRYMRDTVPTRALLGTVSARWGDDALVREVASRMRVKDMEKIEDMEDMEGVDSFEDMEVVEEGKYLGGVGVCGRGGEGKGGGIKYTPMPFKRELSFVEKGGQQRIKQVQSADIIHMQQQTGSFSWD